MKMPKNEVVSDESILAKRELLKGKKVAVNFLIDEELKYHFGRTLATQKGATQTKVFNAAVIEFIKKYGDKESYIYLDKYIKIST